MFRVSFPQRRWPAAMEAENTTRHTKEVEMDPLFRSTALGLISNPFVFQRQPKKLGKLRSKPYWPKRFTAVVVVDRACVGFSERLGQWLAGLGAGGFTRPACQRATGKAGGAARIVLGLLKPRWLQTTYHAAGGGCRNRACQVRSWSFGEAGLACLDTGKGQPGVRGRGLHPATQGHC